MGQEAAPEARPLRRASFGGQGRAQISQRGGQIDREVHQQGRQFVQGGVAGHLQRRGGLRPAHPEAAKKRR